MPRGARIDERSPHERLDERVARAARSRSGSPLLARSAASPLQRAGASAQAPRRRDARRTTTAITTAFPTAPPVIQASSDDTIAKNRVDEQRVAVRMLRRRRLRQPPPQLTRRLVIRAHPLPPRRPRAASRRGSPSATASMSRPSGRSSRSRGESERTSVVCRARTAPGSSGARNSTACAAGEQLDRERALGVRDHLPRLEPGRVAHRHVILLPGARRDRVDATRGGRATCSPTTSDAATYCGIMKPELSPPSRREERRQAVAQSSG